VEEEKKEKLPPKLEEISRKKQEEKEEARKEPETTVDSLLKPRGRQMDRNRGRGKEAGSAVRGPKLVAASYEYKSEQVEEELGLEERRKRAEDALVKRVRELVDAGGCEVEEDGEEAGRDEDRRSQGVEIVRMVLGRMQMAARKKNQEVEMSKITSAKSTQTVAIGAKTIQDDRDLQVESELRLQIEELQCQSELLVRQMQKERDISNIIMANRSTEDRYSESESEPKQGEEGSKVAELLEVVSGLTEVVIGQRQSLRAVGSERDDLMKLTEVLSAELKRRSQVIFGLEDTLSEQSAQQEYHQQCLRSMVEANTFLKSTVAQLVELLGSKLRQIQALESELGDITRQFSLNHQEGLYLQNALLLCLDKFKEVMKAQETVELKRTEQIVAVQNGLLEEKLEQVRSCMEVIEGGRERYLEANQRSVSIYTQLVDNEERWAKLREQFEEQIEELDDENHYLNEDRLYLNNMYLSLQALREQELEENRALDEENRVFVEQQATEILHLKESVKGLKVENGRLMESIEEKCAEIDKLTIKTQAYDKELKASRAYQERQAHNISDLETKSIKEKMDLVEQIEQLETSLRNVVNSMNSQESEHQKEVKDQELREIGRENEELKNKIVFLQSSVEKLESLETQMKELEARANEDLNQLDEKRSLCEELALRNSDLETTLEGVLSRERELVSVLESVAGRVGAFESARECVESMINLWKEDEGAIIRERSKCGLAEEKNEEFGQLLRELESKLSKRLGTEEGGVTIRARIDQVIEKMEGLEESLRQLEGDQAKNSDERENLKREKEGLEGKLQVLESARGEAEANELKEIEEYYESKIKIFEKDISGVTERLQKKEEEVEELREQMESKEKALVETGERMRMREGIEMGKTGELAGELEEARRMVDLEKKAKEEVRELLRQKEEECEGLKGELRNCGDKVNSLETQLNEYKQQVHEEMQALSSDIVSTVQEKQKLSNIISDLESNSSRALEELEKARKERDQLAGELEEYKAGVEEKDSGIRELRDRLAGFEKVQDKSHNSEGSNAAEILLSGVQNELRAKEQVVEQVRDELRVVGVERDGLLVAQRNLAERIKEYERKTEGFEEAMASLESRTRELEDVKKIVRELEERLDSLRIANEALQGQLDLQRPQVQNPAGSQSEVQRGSNEGESTERSNRELGDEDSQAKREAGELEGLKQRVKEEITAREEAQGMVKKQKKQLELLRLDLKEAQDTIKEYEEERDQLHSSLVADYPLQNGPK
jgi:chromosome segregation ATPase